MNQSDIANKVKKFFEDYPRREYPSDQIIIFEGENPPGIMYIQQGLVSEYYVSKKGEKMVINMFKESAFFPISWALNKKPNDYFFETKTKTVLSIAPPEDVINFLHKNPQITMDLLSRILNGIDGVLKRDIHIKKGTAKSLILNELIIAYKRFGKKSIQMDLTAQELANRTGLTRETVSRELKKLSEESIIKQKYGKIEVIDLKRLEKLSII